MRASWLCAIVATGVLCAAESRLVDAAKENDKAAVAALLRQKVDVNAPAADGGTALHWAAYWDDVALAEQLIRAGANAKAVNRYGVAPLTLACTNGSAAMVELLLNAGADANTVAAEGETALMTASRSGSAAVVKLLVARGAKVNEKESWRGQTALMWAAGEGHVAAVEALIAAGADLRARSNAGFTAFLFAVREGKADVVRAMLKAGVSPNEALTPSLRRGNTSGQTVGTSALVLAVQNAHFELASMLLDAGADPNANVGGWAALHIISDVRRPGTGSNDPAQPGSGKMDSLELVKRLVAKGADVNARTTRSRNIGLTSLNTAGATPFLLAARTADVELMRLLAKLGADPKIPTLEHTTPLMVAAGVGTRSPGEDAGTDAEVLEAVKLTWELGNDVNAVDDRGETAMHGAAYKWVAAVVPFLNEKGAKVEIWNRKNRNGWTPLRIAEGVHRGMNLRASPETAAELRKIMEAAGVSTVVEPEAVISGSTK